MSRAWIAALALTIGCGGGAAISFAVDPELTPLRVMAAMALLTALGLAWGRVIWNMRHR